MIIDASDMLTDAVAVVTAVAEFAGLPAHTFQYDSSREHKTGCPGQERRMGTNIFGDGGRFVK